MAAGCSFAAEGDPLPAWLTPGVIDNSSSARVLGAIEVRGRPTRAGVAFSSPNSTSGWRSPAGGVSCVAARPARQDRAGSPPRRSSPASSKQLRSKRRALSGKAGPMASEGQHDMADPVSRPRAAVILAAGKGERECRCPRCCTRWAGAPCSTTPSTPPWSWVASGWWSWRAPHAPEVAAHVRAWLGEGALAVQDPPKAPAMPSGGETGKRQVHWRHRGHLRRRTLAGERRRSSFCSTCWRRGADLAIQGFDAADPAAYGRMILTAAAASTVLSRRGMHRPKNSL